MLQYYFERIINIIFICFSVKKFKGESNKTTKIKPKSYEWELPFGWIKKSVQRLTGKTAGRWDTYIISPRWVKLRSNPEIFRYLMENPNMKYDALLTNTNTPFELLMHKIPKIKSKTISKPKPGTVLLNIFVNI